MPELAPTHIAVLQRLIERGFTFVSFPLYANAIGIRRGSVAALLEPQPGGGFRLVAPASVLLEGNLTVRIQRDGREWYQWKSKQIEATPERIAEVMQFSNELSALLSTSMQSPDPPQ